ncbi:MAG: cytochrome c oxidase assembly protein [Alphaproteobacteria bacterium]|nr:cytochrome c oxidase assembly protein [Alphaproteobacteria bacterium]
MTHIEEGHHKQEIKTAKTAVFLALFVALMVGMAYAAVPLYEAFCQVTGFGGTTQRAETGSDVILARTVRVQFDANVADDLPWDFKPVQREVEVKIGESQLIFYNATNFANKDIKGSAIFNVSPASAGAYFNKIECFCFTEQMLNANQTVDMPVEFFIDPDYATDPDLEHVNIITLSYTFYPAED